MEQQSFRPVDGVGSRDRKVSCVPPQRMASSSFERVDAIIRQLVSVADCKPGTEVNLSEDELMWISRTSRAVFLEQPMLLEVECPMNICGDTHGQYHDLLRLFEIGGFPPRSNYLFLGDYVDRAKQSIETIALLLCYKIRYPDNFFLLRGNHECSALNRIYGFFDECKRRYSVRLWRVFGDCFNCMPVTAIVSKRIICMHGGLSPDLDRLSQIAKMERPIEVPEDGLLCDLVWSDPDPHILGWGYNSRGVSYTFGTDVIRNFLQRHDLELICRAHQVVEDGYEFQSQRSLVTIFSAPNYCGEFDNAAGMMCVDENLCCSFKIIKPVPPDRNWFIPAGAQQQRGNHTDGDIPLAAVAKNRADTPPPPPPPSPPNGDSAADGSASAATSSDQQRRLEDRIDQQESHAAPRQDGGDSGGSASDAQPRGAQSAAPSIPAATSSPSFSQETSEAATTTAPRSSPSPTKKALVRPPGAPTAIRNGKEDETRRGVVAAPESRFAS